MQTFQGCGPYVWLSPWPRAEFRHFYLDASEVIFLFGRLLGWFHFGHLFLDEGYLDILAPGKSSTRDPDTFLIDIFAYFNHYLCKYIFEKFRKVFKTG